MHLKSRLEKLEEKATGCVECSPSRRIEIYREGEEPEQEPRPRYCSRCGRDQGISRIVVMLPDNHREATLTNSRL
jgi:hypothetical protein